MNISKCFRMMFNATNSSNQNWISKQWSRMNKKREIKRNITKKNKQTNEMISTTKLRQKVDERVWRHTNLNQIQWCWKQRMRALRIFCCCCHCCAIIWTDLALCSDRLMNIHVFVSWWVWIMYAKAKAKRWEWRLFPHCPCKRSESMEENTQAHIYIEICVYVYLLLILLFIPC